MQWPTQSRAAGLSTQRAAAPHLRRLTAGAGARVLGRVALDLALEPPLMPAGSAPRALRGGQHGGIRLPRQQRRERLQHPGVVLQRGRGTGGGRLEQGRGGVAVCCGRRCRCVRQPLRRAEGGTRIPAAPSHSPGGPAKGPPPRTALRWTPRPLRRPGRSLRAAQCSAAQREQHSAAHRSPAQHSMQRRAAPRMPRCQPAPAVRPAHARGALASPRYAPPDPASMASTTMAWSPPLRMPSRRRTASMRTHASAHEAGDDCAVSGGAGSWASKGAVRASGDAGHPKRRPPARPTDRRVARAQLPSYPAPHPS